ncbi:TetR/AcrR family transcriptional regulator [Amycolatopsis sp. NPDC059021]|uniref:TetR/AcrR family transcriptional regulator n=1 Tax=Amycolatopsis sp. NPDC059021 TaxID=3346704 RepID=UPI00367068C8
MAGLREAKKEQTRRSLIGAALRLFDEHGYEQTTVADIAGAAGVSPATFFNYFATKEDVVFADQHLYDEVLHEVFATADDSEPIAELVPRTVRALATAPVWSFPLDDPLTAVRARLIGSVPALRAGFLLRNAVFADGWARMLHKVYPDVLTEALAATLTGAVMGALQSGLGAYAGGEPLADVVTRAAEYVVSGFPAVRTDSRAKRSGRPARSR